MPRTKMVRVIAGAMILLWVNRAGAQRWMENLGRGVVAVNQGNGKVFVSWRMLGLATPPVRGRQHYDEAKAG